MADGVEDTFRIQDENSRLALHRALVAIRIGLGWTQQDVATRMGVSQSTVSEFEREVRDSTVSIIARYAWAVGVELQMWIEPKDPELVEPPVGGTEGSEA